MKPLYIFDLDGTLAVIDHRRHLLAPKLTVEDVWRSFYSACDGDAPNHAVIATMEKLRQAGAEIWIFSGRSDEVRDKTIAWLAKHTSFSADELEGPMLTMRRAGYWIKDDALKMEWYASMLHCDKERLVAVFDDRDRVVAMWRSLGVPCFQVAPGNF